MSNIGFGGVTDFAMTSTATAVRVMGVTGVGSSSETVQGTSLALNFVSAPTGYPVLDPRVTFSRASNATLTNSDGLIAYAPHNLLAYSEEFDNAAWTKNTATVTANAAVAPDGTATADLVTSTGADGYFGRGQSGLTGNQQFTASIYLRADADTTVRLYLLEAVGGSAVQFVDCNVTTVWQRFSVSFTTGAAVTALSTQVGGASSFGTGETVYAWGYQLNVGALQPYYTTTVKNLLGYTQEFDNAAWTKSNSFILTNLLTYSEQFDNVNWAKTNATITADAAVSPDGTTDGDKLVENTANSIHALDQTLSFTSGTSYTVSVYVKAAERPTLQLVLVGTAFNESRTWFDLATGVATITVGAVTSAFVTSVGNGWYRVGVTQSAIATSTANISFRIWNGTTAVYTGDGTSGIYIWGAQLVQGATAGDYQQTVATALPMQYSAPDGSMTADKLVEDVNTGGHSLTWTQTITAGTVYVLSLYAKEDPTSAKRYLTLYANSGFTGTASYGCTFNLADGTVTRQQNGFTGTITPVGNGWYRCAVFTTLSTGSSAGMRISLSNSASGSVPQSYTGDGTSGIYIWGAQLSDSASLDPYVYNPVAAPAAAAYYGPRFDYDPVTLAPNGLLIEEQRTNLALYSEQFDNAVWVDSSTTSTTRTADQIAAPDGTTTADLILNTTTLNRHTFQQSFSVASGTATYSASVYIKEYIGSGTPPYFVFYLGNSFQGLNRAGICVNTSTFTVDNTVFTAGSGTLSGYSVTPVGNDWYKITISASIGETGAITLRMCFGISNTLVNAPLSNSYIGDGNTGFYLWGAQLEAATFATSYIPTTTAAATRAADAASMIGANFSNWYNQAEGTFYAQFRPMTSDFGTNKNMFLASDGTTANFVGLRYGSSGSQAAMAATTSAVLQANIVTGAMIAGTSYKLAGAYKANDFAASRDAGTFGADTNGTVPVVTQAEIGMLAGTAFGSQTISRIAYFPRRLTNAELRGITS